MCNEDNKQTVYNSNAIILINKKDCKRFMQMDVLKNKSIIMYW